MPVTNPHAVLEGRDLKGNTVFYLPADPWGAGPGQFCLLYDWIEHEDLWLAPRPGGLMGGGPDTQFLLDQNFTINQRSLKFEHDWAELWGAEKGKLALVISCGPSLSTWMGEALKLREAHPDRFFTIGLNRALRAMPLDYFFALDRRGQPDWAVQDYPSTKAILSTTVNPSVAGRFTRRYWIEHYLARKPAPLITGGATQLAMTLPDVMMAAYKLGASSLFLYGCDFGVSVKRIAGRDTVDKYYFDTPAEEPLRLRASRFPVVVPVRGIFGNALYVNPEMTTYATYVKAICLILERHGIRVYNRSDHSMLFHGEDRPDGYDTLLNPVPVCQTPDAG